MGANADKAKGRMKEAAGALTGDKDLKRKGKLDQAGGKAKEKAGRAVDKTKRVARRIGTSSGRQGQVPAKRRSNSAR